MLSEESMEEITTKLETSVLEKWLGEALLEQILFDESDTVGKISLHNSIVIMTKEYKKRNK